MVLLLYLSFAIWSLNGKASCFSVFISGTFVKRCGFRNEFIQN